MRNNIAFLCNLTYFSIYFHMKYIYIYYFETFSTTKTKISQRYIRNIAQIYQTSLISRYHHGASHKFLNKLLRIYFIPNLKLFGSKTRAKNEAFGR